MKRIVVTEAHIAGLSEIQVESTDLPQPHSHAQSTVPAWSPKRPEMQEGKNYVANRFLLEASGMITQPEHATFKSFLGILDTGHDFSATQLELKIPDETRQRHTLVVGKTGSGKTSKALLPMIWADLCCEERSLVVFDVKGDLTGPVIEMAIRARAENANIRYISFGERDKSLAWNPFDSVSNIGEAVEIAQCLSQIGEGGAKNEGAYFRHQAEKLISSFIFGMSASEEGCVPANLRRLFDLDPADLVKEAESIAGEALSQVVYAAGANHNAETSLMEAQNYLLPFLDPSVAATTSYSEFQFSELDHRPTVLIVRCPEGVQRLAAVVAIFVKRLFSWVVEEADKSISKRLSRPVCCYIDEFASALGRLPDMERVINTLRSRHFEFTAAVQSVAQITRVYGDTDGNVLFEGFGTLIFLPPGGVADAKLFSERSGSAQFIRYEPAPGSARILREHVETRNRLAPHEIGFPPVHPEWGSMATLLLPDMLPILGFMPPIWKQPEFRAWDRANGGDGSVAHAPLRSVPLAAPANVQKKIATVKLGGFPPGITDVRGWPEEKIKEALERTKKNLDWENTTGSARKWWEAYEADNRHRMSLVFRLAEELQRRKASVTEFFLSSVYANTDNIQANLHYLDYTRLKKEEERKRREAARTATCDGSDLTSLSSSEGDGNETFKENE